MRGFQFREEVFTLKKARIRLITVLAGLATFLLSSGAGWAAR